MRVERQGRLIHIAIKNGNQERWFNIEEHEAQELALKLGEVLSEPKKPKFVVGDRVKVIKDDIMSECPLGTRLTIRKNLNEHNVGVVENDWAWPVDWLEKVEPLKLKMGDRVRVIKDAPSRGDSYVGEILTIEEALPGGKAVYVCDNDWVWDIEWLELVEEG